MIELQEVPSRHDAAFAAFAEVARRAHADDSGWVPDSEEAVDWAFAESAAGRTPLRAWVALDGDVPLARAAALASGTSIGWIGLFACVPGAREAAVAVLDACCQALAAWGYAEVEAPHSDPLTIGLQVGGFGAPHTLFTPRHPVAYLGHFEAAGFEVRQRMVAPIVTRERLPALPSRIPGVTVRPLDVEHLERDLAAFHTLQGAVFGARPGREARDPGGTRRLLERLLPYVDPDLVLVAERADELVGTLVCLPDGWQSRDGGRIDRARILSIAVRADLRRRGIALAMAGRLARTLVAKGYRSCEVVWVREENRAPLALAERFGGTVGRRFALLGRSLASG
jgi:ribosomal protein S18 acetylase RimI-like enzyme